MKIRLKLLLSILLFILLYASYYFGIPAVIDIQHRLPAIKKVVKKELGIEIKLENPGIKMGLTPSIWLDASSFSVLDKKSNPLEVINPKIKIKLIPLLFGKIHLSYLSCDKINADFKIDKNNHLYIGNYLILKNSNPRLSIEDSQIDIESYDIKLKDEIQNKNIILKGDYFDLEKYNSKERIKLSMNSQIKINERYSDINMDIDFKLPLKKGFDTNEIVFDGTVTNLNLEDFSPYIRKFSDGKIKQTRGILNIQADTKALNRWVNRINAQMAVQNLEIIGNDKASSVLFKDKLNIKTICDFSKNSLNIKQFQILSGSINLAIAGKINKISSKNPYLDLSILVNKSKIEDFISLIPAVNFKNVDINLIALKKYGYYSDLQGKILIKGKSDKPNIKGEFLSKNGYIIKPLNIPKATVKLKFLGQKVYLDVLVPTGKNENMRIKGPIDLYDKKESDLDISSTQNIDLQTAESIFNPIHEIFYFELGPLPVMKLAGNGNIKLKIQGNKQSAHLLGVFNFKNATASFDGLNTLLTNGEGSLYFNDQNTHFITKKAFLEGKPITIDGKCNLLGQLDFDVNSKGQDLNKILSILKTSSWLKDVQKSIYSINNPSGKVNFDLKLKGQVKNVNDFSIGKTVDFSGNVKLLGNNVSLGNLNVLIKNLIGNIRFKNSDADFELDSDVIKSKIHIKGKVKDNALYSKVKLDDINFEYSNIPVKIFSGNIEIVKDKLMLYKINGTLDSMPILTDGFITDIFKNPNINIYIDSKPTQKFIDKYINKNSVYPLKMKGDIIYSSRINGTQDLLNVKTEINLEKDSNIYYMGSTLGDVNNPIRIFLDASISKNNARHLINVNNFQYDKLISSQNDKEFVSQQLNAKGQISVAKNNISLHSFRVKTQNPTDAKIFNLLFKKPMIKQGVFTSNIMIDGAIVSPKMLGSLNFSGINMPLVDTTIKDISLDFTDKNVDIKSKGEIFSNQITFFANMENRLTPPYVLNNVDIYLGNLDVNEIVKSVNKLELESDMNKVPEQKNSIDLTNIIINNAKLKAESVLVKNVFAKNLTANFSLNEKMLFSLDNFKFDAAQGSVSGDFEYNLLNSKTALNLRFDDVNADSTADALFDLPSQVSGGLTGQVNLTCNGKTHKTCMDTLSGKGGFSIKDGKMPKLGSLEYLLKGANVVKSGVTGLTINSIVELVSPLKTGQFENINGMFSINSGIANEIQIFSKGKDLSLFLTGTYNFSTLVADMEVFGRISKKISSILGPVGNTSLNTLFNAIPGVNLDSAENGDFVKKLNKIPGFELNDKTYRIFSAEIYGDINGDNYVQSFKWVE